VNPRAILSIRRQKVMQKDILDKLVDKARPILAVNDLCSRKSSFRFYHGQ
jgi:hypothetical protein